ncbi:MAG: receptor-interacting serine/threonine-protein kinase 4, partial [Mucilaginibacter sp.]|nr:receptor-interacting serine/threonine-protein kinase 4 [Mucilaginibacter sp.]
MNIVSAILWQLTEWLPRLVDGARLQPRPGQKHFRPIQNYAVDDLCNIIDRTLRRLTQSDAVIVAIDALDECLFSPGRDPFLRLLEELLSSTESGSRPVLKLLLSTRTNSFGDIVRSHPRLESGQMARSGSPVISVADENWSGIRLHTAHQLAAWAGQSSEKRRVKNNLQETIVRQSGGIFLWTVLAIESLFRTGSSPADLAQALRSLPPDNDLFRLLTWIVGKIPKENIEKARDMITFTIMSSRSLSITELTALLAVHKSRNHSEVAHFTSVDIERDVQTLCRSLVTCAQGVVVPFHSTVREFFQDDCCPKEFRIERTSGHNVFAETCLKCLRFMRIPSKAETNAPEPLQYAADNLLYHTMRTSEQKRDELVDPIRTFLWSREWFQTWLQFVWNGGEILKRDLVLMQVKSAKLKDEFGLTMPHDVNPIQILALTTQNDRLFAKMVSNPERDPGWCSLNDADGQGRTVVHWAAGQERTREEDLIEGGEIISGLLRKGLNADARTNNGRSPLHIASQHGRSENLIALLEHGADLNATDQESLTPLHLAVLQGSMESMQELINMGASVNTQGRDQWTPLHFAAQNGDAEAIHALMDAGASVDARDTKQWTPLHFAAQNGHAEAIDALVAAGASVNATDEDQWTCLHLAADGGHTEAI